MIAIIDYKAGNLHSVEKALKFINVNAVVTHEPELILNADGVILPGVGAFSDCIASLRHEKLDEVVLKVIDKAIPFIGICLGYQMLFEYSEEHAVNGGAVKGLGVFKGGVRRIPGDIGLKVPHIGWSNLLIEKPSPLLAGLPDAPFVYFVHSYYVESEDRDIVAARCRYGIMLDVCISEGNVFGTQFHPEKSGDTGITILKNFAKVVYGK